MEHQQKRAKMKKAVLRIIVISAVTAGVAIGVSKLVDQAQEKFEAYQEKQARCKTLDRILAIKSVFVTQQQLSGCAQAGVPAQICGQVIENQVIPSIVSQVHDIMVKEECE